MRLRPRITRRLAALVAAMSLLLLTALSSAPAGASSAVDWSTFGFDAQRTGYNPFETTIGTGNAAGLHKLWSVDLGDVMIAQPVEAAGVDINGTSTNVIYVGTEHGDFYGLRATDGSTVWHRNLGSVDTGCSDMPDDIFGIGGAAAVDHGAGVVYLAGGDGKVHAMDMATGTEEPGWPVGHVFDRNQEHVYGGLNIDAATNQLYVVVASHCDFSPYQGKLTDIDIPSHSKVATFKPAGNQNGGGIWGPGGASLDPGNGHVFVATGNALANPEYFKYSEDVVELDSGLNVLGHNYPGLTGGDVDFGATPILYQRPGCPAQVTAKNKSGVLVTYTEGDVSAGYTQRLQIADVNDYQFNGIPAWDPKTNMLYIGNSSDSSSGIYLHGMMALKVTSACKLRLAWQQPVGPNPSSVSPPTVANGVVYYGDGYQNEEFAFDAKTGDLLWSSGSTIGGGLYAAPTVVNGQLLVPSWDHRLYAFGV